jgi:hypothetical protein
MEGGAGGGDKWGGAADFGDGDVGDDAVLVVVDLGLGRFRMAVMVTRMVAGWWCRGWW